MVYDLPVEDVKVKSHQVTTLHMICALAFLVTGTIIVIYNYTIPLWGAGILATGILLVVLVMVKNKWVISNKINPVLRSIEFIISAAIAYYSLVQRWKFPAIIFGMLSAFLLFALFWERSSGPLTVHLDKEGVKLPSTSRRRFRPWTEIEEVILRFGILTINCTDNTLLQWAVKGQQTNDEVFEAWCSAQVEENRSKREKDWWSPRISEKT